MNDETGREKEVDGSAGLQYLRNRYYDMETGRFISRDPLSAMPGWVEHPYMHASANPVNLVDPLGLCGWKDPVGCVRDAGAAVGGALKSAADATANALASTFNALRAAIGTATGWVRDTLVSMYNWISDQVMHVASLIREYAGQIARGCAAAWGDCASDIFLWIHITAAMGGTIAGVAFACITVVGCVLSLVVGGVVFGAWVAASAAILHGIAQRDPRKRDDEGAEAVQAGRSPLTVTYLEGTHKYESGAVWNLGRASSSLDRFRHRVRQVSSGHGLSTTPAQVV